MNRARRVIISLLIMGAVGFAVTSTFRSEAEEPTVDHWVAALKNEKWEARKEAAEALGKLGDLYAAENAIDPLIAALQDHKTEVRDEAEGALVKLTGENYGQDPKGWQKWWNTFLEGGGGY